MNLPNSIRNIEYIPLSSWQVTLHHFNNFVPLISIIAFSCYERPTAKLRKLDVADGLQLMHNGKIVTIGCSDWATAASCENSYDRFSYKHEFAIYMHSLGIKRVCVKTWCTNGMGRWPWQYSAHTQIFVHTYTHTHALYEDIRALLSVISSSKTSPSKRMAYDIAVMHAYITGASSIS